MQNSTKTSKTPKAPKALHIDFGKVPNLKGVVRELTRFVGIELNNGKIEEFKLPVLNVQGTEKIHGTNAGITYGSKERTFWVQSRNTILDENSDMYGLYAFCQERKEKFIALCEEVSRVQKLDLDNNYITVYFEFAGGNIQKSSALDGVEKSAMIFKHCRVTPTKVELKRLEMIAGFTEGNLECAIDRLERVNRWLKVAQKKQDEKKIALYKKRIMEYSEKLQKIFDEHSQMILDDNELRQDLIERLGVMITSEDSSVSETSEETSEKTPEETSEKTPETSEKTPETSEKTPETSEKTPEETSEEIPEEKRSLIQTLRVLSNVGIVNGTPGTNIETSIGTDVLGNSIYADYPEERIYNLMNVSERYNTTIDFNEPQDIIQEKLLKTVLAIEQDSPCGKALGKDNNIAEGIVYTFEYKDRLFRFKIKGDKHVTTKPPKPPKSKEELEEERKIRECAEQCVPGWRLEQGFKEVYKVHPQDADNLTDTERKSGIPKFFKWISKDISDEEGENIEELGLERKQVLKITQQISKKWLFSVL